MATFNVTFSNVLLTLLYLFPGFLLQKCRKVRAEHLSTVSVILLYVCGPGMFLNALTAPDYSPALLGKMGLFLVFSLAGETALMLLILLFLGKNEGRNSACVCCPLPVSWGTSAFSACR